MNMLTNRVVPWFGIGKEAGDFSKVNPLLDSMGLNWKVEPKRIYTDLMDGLNLSDMELLPISNVMANVRGSDQKILGIVSDKYKIIQNNEAFSFLDYMIPEGLQIEKGGMINDRKVWMVGKYQNGFDAGGDHIDTYVVFTNSHDGKGSIRICITPIRVVCQNTLSLAFSKSYRSWSISHTGDAHGKLHTAEESILQIDEYIRRFQAAALAMVATRVDDERLRMLLERLFPLGSDYTEQKEKVVIERRGIVTDIFKNSPDLGRPNAWHFVNAVSDYAMHYLPDYDEKLYRTSTFSKTLNGHPLIDHAFNLIAAA